MNQGELFDAVMRANGVPEALQELRYSSVVEVIDEVIAVNPAATVADVRQSAATRRAAVGAQLDEAEARKERAVCQHCQVAIVRSVRTVTPASRATRPAVRCSSTSPTIRHDVT